MSAKVTSKKNKNYKKTAVKKVGFNFMLIPLIFVLAIVPIFTRMYEYKTHLEDFPWYSFETDKTDFFLYYKSVLFIAASAVMAAIAIIKLIHDKKKIKWTAIFIPLAAYGFLALLSTVFSDYSYFGIHGIYEQFEPVFDLLGYCIAAYYAYLCVNSEKDIKPLIYALLVSMAIMVAIGFSQALSHDFFQTSFGSDLIVPADARLEGGLTFNFEPGRVYMSLYNPNYVGSYAALVIPLLIVLLIFGRKWQLSICYALLIIGVLICLFGSQSRSGIVAIACSLLVFLVIMYRELLRKWDITIISMTLLICTFLTINNLNDGVLLNKILAIFSPAKTTQALTDIKTNDENIEFVYNNETLSLQFIFEPYSGMLAFLANDGSGNTLECTPSDEEGHFAIQDERFSSFVLSPVTFENGVGFSVTVDGIAWYFINTQQIIEYASQSLTREDGTWPWLLNAINNYSQRTYYFYTPTGKMDKMREVESAVFDEYASFASGRGYIWSRSIPLLLDNFVLGSGADTFSIEFPNDDYVGKAYNGYQTQILTKPHNMYLQIGVQTGTLSLIAVLVFYMMYFISSIKIYWRRRFTSFTSQVGVGIFIGSVGYMITGIINDSTITVAPIFWILMGLGIAINKLLRDNDAAEAAAVPGTVG